MNNCYPSLNSPHRCGICNRADNLHSIRTRWLCEECGYEYLKRYTMNKRTATPVKYEQKYLKITHENYAYYLDVNAGIYVTFSDKEIIIESPFLTDEIRITHPSKESLQALQADYEAFLFDDRQLLWIVPPVALMFAVRQP